MEYVRETNKVGLGVDVERLISKFCLDFGSSRRTVQEYVKVLENSEYFKIIDGRLWDPNVYSALQEVEENKDKENKLNSGGGK